MGNESFFHELLVAAHHAANADFLVTLGIEPTFPATGFGYIQQGQEIGVYGGLKAYQVVRFKEKPEEEQARAMLAAGDHSWNSGMFVWKVKHILEEFKRQMPELAAGLRTIQAAWGTPAQQAAIERVWPGLKSETIDYGIMEKANNVVVIPAAGLQWSDVGTWNSLFEVIQGDERGNIIMGGQHVGLDTSQTLVYMEKEHRLIVTIGVDDLVLVDTGDVLLVCRKDQAQKVRQVVEQLKLTGQDYL
jgi:mannose-1-phosphate guanylyltransferase